MVIGHNEDLITEILLRLPVKSILGFKTVSKQWLSIVSSSRFRQIHSASGAATSTGLLFNTYTTPEFLSLDKQIYYPMPNSDQPPPLKIKILSSSGGLLLLLRSRSRSRHYSIWNPITNEIKPLAAGVPEVIHKSRHVAACLAFDPTKSLHYKVFFVYRRHKKLVPGERFPSMIYSSETRTFRSLETFFTSLPRGEIYWNDAIHWISNDPTGSTHFNLSKECTNVYHLPGKDAKMYIGEYRGNLLTVTCDVNLRSRYFSLFRVYELSKRDYSGWSLMYEVDLGSFGIQCPLTSKPIRGATLFIGILVDEEQDLSIVVAVSMDGTLVACNLKKKLYSFLEPLGAPNGRNYDIVVQYKETLAGWV